MYQEEPALISFGLPPELHNSCGDAGPRWLNKGALEDPGQEPEKTRATREREI